MLTANDESSASLGAFQNGEQHIAYVAIIAIVLPFMFVIWRTPDPQPQPQSNQTQLVRETNTSAPSPPGVKPTDPAAALNNARGPVNSTSR